MATPSSSLPAKTFRFGVFEIDLEAQQLRKAGALVRLQPHPFKVLSVLVCRAGQIVSREDLRREVWGQETFVDFEQGLNFCIRQIRVMLGDEAQTPHYIETIPRRGYRFIAHVNGLEITAPGKPKGRVVIWPWSWDRGPKLVFAAALGVFAVALIALATLGRFGRSPALTTKDSLLVTEFVNNTGDPIFDSTLRKAASIDLDQSPYLNIVSDDKLKQSLAFMGKAPGTPITPEIGREICRRNGIRAMLTGSITKLGGQYVLTLAAMDAASGDTLAEEQAQAAGKEKVINALGKSSARLREKLGETLASIQQFDKPLVQVTTPSLEAFQLFNLGAEKRLREGELAAIPFLQRAVQLDPNFALAYASLGAAYSNIEQVNLAEDCLKKAFDLSDRVSEREKLYITAHYYQTRGQIEKEIETYELYAKLYPKDALPQNNLALRYNELGRFDKALDHALLGLDLGPSSLASFSRRNAAHAYAGLGRLNEAKVILMDGLKSMPDNSLLRMDLSNIALAQGDTLVHEQADALLKANPEGTLNLLYRNAALAASHGQLRQAEELYSQTKQIALKLGLKDNAWYAVALQAQYEAYLQHPTLATTNARAALKMSQMLDVVTTAAWALASGGDDREARNVINVLAKRRPDDTLVHFVWAPSIEALASLNHRDAEHAIQALAPGAQYDRANLDSMLLRANAYLQAKRTSEAIEEFDRIVALKRRFPYDPACSLAQLGLARTYSFMGDKAKSRAAYEDFFALWKDADPDIPILKRANAEYAKLH